jgi:RNA-directed DNA polymerase
VISPLLSNIALNNIEKKIGDWAETHRLSRPNNKLINNKTERCKSVMFIRYADDFVIMNRDLNIIQECKRIISKFLAERGLELSVAKTKIVHTRIPFEKNEPGSEFLGFKIKHFDTKRRSAKNKQSHNIGFRLFIFPSKDNRKKNILLKLIAYCVHIRP